MEWRIKTTAMVIILMLCSNVAGAQTVPPLPPSNLEAGTVNKEIEVKNKYKDLIQEKIKDEKEKSESEKSLDLKSNDDNKRMQGNIDKTGFILKEITYEGNTLFTAEELNTAAAGYINKYTTMDDLKVIMNKITNYYNNDGYITTFAYLPAQKIQEGKLKISLVEGKISKLTVKGNKWAKNSYLINNVLKANGLKEGNNFNVSNLRKSLGKINEVDYLKGRVILNKGDDPESAEVTLEVDDRFPLMFRSGWNNQGREFIGQQRAVLTLGDENITGYGDRLYGSTTFAKETFGVNTDYYVPLGPYGTELRVGCGYTNIEVGKSYKDLGIVGRAHGISAGLTQPIYEGKTTKVTSDLTFDSLSAKTYQNKNVLYDRYELRALRFGLNGIKDDSSGRWVSRLEAHTGLPIMGATTAETLSGGSSKFFRLNPSLVRIQALPYKTTGIFKVMGQYSPSTLLSVEQLQVGGMNSVRGFKEGTLFAHSGYIINLELRRPIPYLPDYKYLKLKDRVQLALFYDQGLGKVRGENIRYNNFMQSLGFGFRIHLTEYLNANLDFGIPLGGSVTPNKKDPMRFHFNIISDVL